MTAALTGTNAAVRCRDLSVALGGHEILADIELAVPEGQWATVIGPNGAGKTTLIRAVAGLVDYAGEITLGGTAMADLPARQRARLFAF